jgi:putative transposase
VLLRLAYLGVTNAPAMLRLLPMSAWAKDAEILAVRDQIMVLERQLSDAKVSRYGSPPPYAAMG